MQLALSQGARETALRHAQEAFGEARSARWAWRAILESRLEAGDWSGGLELVKGALDRKIVPPVVAAAIVNARRSVAVPPELVAVTLTVDVPAVPVGVPEMRPDVAFRFSPAGRPVAANEVGVLLAVIV